MPRSNLTAEEFADLKQSLHNVRLTVDILKAFCDDLGALIDKIPEPPSRYYYSSSNVVWLGGNSDGR